MKQLLQTIYNHYEPNVEPDFEFNDIVIVARKNRMGAMVDTIKYYLDNEHDTDAMQEALGEVEDYLIRLGEKNHISDQERQWLIQITEYFDNLEKQ